MCSNIFSSIPVYTTTTLLLLHEIVECDGNIEKYISNIVALNIYFCFCAVLQC